MGNYQESADLFKQLLDEGAPSAVVLRGLGIGLARVGKYDDAFKHLRIAHEMEEPKDRLTAGYLALCGARGKPSQPEAKIQNVVWAVRLVTHFNAPQDAEWAGIISELFAEAREHNIPLSLDDQLYLCEHLWSVHATDVRVGPGVPSPAPDLPGLGAARICLAVLPGAAAAWVHSLAAAGHSVRGPKSSRLRPATCAIALSTCSP